MKKYITEIKWGCIFILALLLWMGFEKMMGWHDVNIDQHAMMTNFFAIPAIVIYILALLDKRKRDYGGVMSWKQGFVTGLIITVVIAILSPLAQFIIHNIISPDYFENIREYTVTMGEMTQENADAYFSMSSYITQSVIGALAMGVLTSAVVAAFTRKNPE
jgi:hypothetical protein